MTIAPLLDSAQVAALLKCSPRTVEDYARDGRLPAAKFGEGWVFPAEALMRAVNRIAEEEASKRLAPSKKVAATFEKCISPKPLSRARPNLRALTSEMPQPLK